MDVWRFILASLQHYWRIHVAVALGVAVATAVLTGALLVGDSLRGSLRGLTLQRLGRIDSVVLAGHPFRAALAQELAAYPEFKTHYTTAEPALLLTGTLQAGSGRAARRANSVAVIGCTPDFWGLGEGGPAEPLADDELALTDAVARELGVKIGDGVIVRVPAATAVPADSTLGRKSETAASRTMKVAAVLSADGLARFGIMPSQQLPRNVFVPLASLQSLMNQPGKANAILVARADSGSTANLDAEKALERALRPKLEDFGVQIEEIGGLNPSIQISADRLVLPDEIVRAVKTAFRGEAQPVVTYLANTVEAGEGSKLRKFPYSTIVGVDSTASLGPLLDEKGQPVNPADDEIVLNRWAADDLGVKIGDPVRVRFYEPESTHGELREHEPPVPFRLKAIVELTLADGKPTAAADQKLAPELPGVTDQKSIHDWDLPFELTETIRPKDEDYWNEYRTTPKAFVSLKTAERLWASRWGTISLMRLPVAASFRDANPRHGETRPGVAEQLQQSIVPAALGMTILPVKAQGLAASAGTTPFEALFIGFSFFLIAAAIMLVSLLFQLGIEQRARELGTLAALGIDRKPLTRLLSREGFVVAATGATVGAVCGVADAWLMVFGLRTWWLAAISTPFIRLHIAPVSIVAGWFIGVAVSWLTIRWSIRRLTRLPVTRLIAGNIGPTAVMGGQCEDARDASSSRLVARGKVGIKVLSWPALQGALAAIVVVQIAVGFLLQGEAQAGVFFGSGAAMLVLLLGGIRHWLRNSSGVRSFERSFSLLRLSVLNTARNPGRSALTIGLVAAASFLIVAVSAFRLDTGEGGTGNFAYVATSDLPIHYDLNTAEGRLELGFSAAATRQLEDWRFYSARVADGENASCLNLYQPSQPRVLGLPSALIDRGGFAWAARDGRYSENPWKALDTTLQRDEGGPDVVPVVLDLSTAKYSLHLNGVGSRIPIRDSADRIVTLQVVGLLRNSVLQGNLLVSEKNFLKLFPEAAGYRFFLIEGTGQRPMGATESENDGVGETAATAPRSLPGVLESTLAEEGFDVRSAREQLAQFLAVQNTYLSTFQSLGALGLLLGTVGLAVVQIRSVVERRGELALMRAGGFPPRRLTWMVVGENAVLLLGGLAVGCLAAAVALIPQWLPQAARVPWAALGALLTTIAVFGMAAGWLATRAAVRAPLVGALRGD